MADTVVVALFRHGLTEENKKQAYIGWTDSPICEEAKQTVGNIKTEPLDFNRIITSDLKRCLQTAEILFPKQQPHILREFREMNFGKWEGKTYKELEEKPEYKEWLRHHFVQAPPEGESFAVFSDRVETGWKKVQQMMIEEKADRVAVVTHGGVVRYLLSMLANKEKDFWDWKVPHGNGYELQWPNMEAFRRGDLCTLLREVHLTENQNG